MAKAIAALCSLLLCAAAARAGVEGFLGSWENPVRRPSGLYHVVVTPSGNSRVNIRLYGDCRPGECDWGVTPADDYRYARGTQDLVAVSALVHFGFAHRRITLRLAGKDRLAFSVAIAFVAETGRRDIEAAGILRRSNWTGMVGKAEWEQPVDRDIGWGGGARGARLRAPLETCERFDPSALRLRRDGATWTIAAKGKTILRTGWGEKQARHALATIRRYGFDRKCHTGTMEFWKVGDGFPAADDLGPGCLKFSSTTAHVTRIGRAWKVIEGGATIADTNVSRDNAYAVLAMVRRYHLERKCAVGWPNPAMVYWLTAEH